MNAFVGRNLKALREANNFTQEKVADFLDVKRSAYSNYESGEREAFITQDCVDRLMSVSITQEARMRGYDCVLYGS